MANSKKYTVNACRWFDKANGNTYHSVKVTRHSDGAVIANGWHYGYDDHYKQTAQDLMEAEGWIESPKDTPSHYYDRDNGYPIIWNVSDGLKRDMVANGILS